MRFGCEVRFVMPDGSNHVGIANSNFINFSSGYNGIVFRQLDIEEDRHEYATAAFGYPSDSGHWPESKHNDFEAQLRLLVALARDFGIKIYIEGRSINHCAELENVFKL